MKRFENEIDWNFNNYGKLWTYNLNYFEFLLDESIEVETRLKLVHDFINATSYIRDGFEPYPCSLRIMNWIKFLSIHKIQDRVIDDHLWSQCKWLTRNIEYHLLGNHLIENGFALFACSIYFVDDKLRKLANSILIGELEEQILEDGGHYERSPMYHKIVLERVLDAYQWSDSENHTKLNKLLRTKAAKMLGWLSEISYLDRTTPNVNDSAENISAQTQKLIAYGNSLSIKNETIRLGQSGFRSHKNMFFETFVDIGNITPKYQPGHSHAGTFSFELKYLGNAIIVDPGISTYEKSYRRQLERSTLSHNTIMVDDQDSSEVWGGFRIGRRAQVELITDSNDQIVARHDGYRHLDVIHQREFVFAFDKFDILDLIESRKQDRIAVSQLHFHPSIIPELEDNTITLNNGLRIQFEGYEDLRLETYKFAAGFNNLIDSLKIRATVKQNSKIHFYAG